MKKSDTSEMLMRMLMCSSSQRRMKSTVVRLMVSTSCPKSISQISVRFCWVMPTSTMAWVRKGSVSWMRQPTISPRIICPKCCLCCLM